MLFTIIASICIAIGIIKWLLESLHIDNYGDKYVFITGCDSGFGNLLAKKLDGMGLHVFAGCLTDRGAKELKQACSARLETIELNVTSEDSIAKAAKEVEDKLPENKGKQMKLISELSNFEFVVRPRIRTAI